MILAHLNAAIRDRNVLSEPKTRKASLWLTGYPCWTLTCLLVLTPLSVLNVCNHGASDFKIKENLWKFFLISNWAVLSLFKKKKKEP